MRGRVNLFNPITFFIVVIASACTQTPAEPEEKVPMVSMVLNGNFEEVKENEVPKHWNNSYEPENGLVGIFKSDTIVVFAGKRSLHAWRDTTAPVGDAFITQDADITRITTDQIYELSAYFYTSGDYPMGLYISDNSQIASVSAKNTNGWQKVTDTFVINERVDLNQLNFRIWIGEGTTGSPEGWIDSVSVMPVQ